MTLGSTGCAGAMPSQDTVMVYIVMALRSYGAVVRWEAEQEAMKDRPVPKHANITTLTETTLLPDLDRTAPFELEASAITEVRRAITICFEPQLYRP